MLAEDEHIVQGLADIAATDSEQPLTDGRGKTVTPSEFFEAVRTASAPYRVACGYVSRKAVTGTDEASVRSMLFRARHRLDSRVVATIMHHLEVGAIGVERLLRRQVFGFCKKQGVSFRLSLSTCVPSSLCGGGCYAHDGRERLSTTILSGCYNTVLCSALESGRLKPEKLLSKVRKAVELALLDQRLSASEYGFQRRARIRLAHVGEIAAYPDFANWLGTTVGEVSDDRVDCVVYTRHPGVAQLDTSSLVVNLTLDAASQDRRRWLRPGIRPVWSAWDGKVDPDVAVNFLEHHDGGQHSLPLGTGNVCPVTTASTEMRVCDEFGCTLCFDRIGKPAQENPHNGESATLGQRRTRNLRMLNEMARVEKEP